jgi:hypothetical protein
MSAKHFLVDNLIERLRREKSAEARRLVDGIFLRMRRVGFLH